MASCPYQQLFGQMSEPTNVVSCCIIKTTHHVFFHADIMRLPERAFVNLFVQLTCLTIQCFGFEDVSFREGISLELFFFKLNQIR